MSDFAELASRIDRIESQLAIQQLPARYALAIDSRDLNTWVNLFVEDVDCGRYGKGREALLSFIDPTVRTFYRSHHQICGHVIDFIDDEHALRHGLLSRRTRGPRQMGGHGYLLFRHL